MTPTIMIWASFYIIPINNYKTIKDTHLFDVFSPVFNQETQF